MRTIIFAMMTVLLTMPALRADPPSDNAKLPTPEQQYKDLVNDVNARMQKFLEAYRKAKTPEEKQKVLKETPPPDRQKVAAQLVKLAEENPHSSFAPDALAWGVTHIGWGPDTEKARSILFKDYIQSKALANLVYMLGDMPSEEHIKLLRRILQENPHRQVKGEAHFALGQILMYYQKKDTDKEAEKEFEKVVKSYGDIKAGGRSLTDLARPALYELQHLAVGMVAPNIVGMDADGKRFQLADYRGKVVVLDFWAEW